MPRGDDTMTKSGKSAFKITWKGLVSASSAVKPIIPLFCQCTVLSRAVFVLSEEGLTRRWVEPDK